MKHQLWWFVLVLLRYKIKLHSDKLYELHELFWVACILLNCFFSRMACVSKIELSCFGLYSVALTLKHWSRVTLVLLALTTQFSNHYSYPIKFFLIFDRVVEQWQFAPSLPKNPEIKISTNKFTFLCEPFWETILRDNFDQAFWKTPAPLEPMQVTPPDETFETDWVVFTLKTLPEAQRTQNIDFVSLVKAQMKTSCKDNSRYRVNIQGLLCLWQCLVQLVHHLAT